MNNLMIIIYIYTPVLMQDAFLSKLEIVITKKSTMKVTVDEEWLSEKEMREDYHWSTCPGSIKSSGASCRVLKNKSILGLQF